MAATQIFPNSGTQFAYTFEASAAIAATSEQPLLVDITGEGTVAATATTATLQGIGFVIDNVASGEQVTVYLVGPVINGTAGETIAAEEPVGPSTVTAGRLDDADATGDFIVGTALQAAVVGEKIAVLCGSTLAQLAL